MIVEREENIEAVCHVVELKGKASTIPDGKRLAWKLPRCLGIHGNEFDIPESLAVGPQADIGAGVSFDGAEVGADGFLDSAIEADGAILQEDSAGAEHLEDGHIVTDKEDGAPLIGHILHFVEALALEVGITNREHFIHNEDFGVEVSSDGKCEANIHPA